MLCAGAVRAASRGGTARADLLRRGDERLLAARVRLGLDGAVGEQLPDERERRAARRREGVAPARRRAAVAADAPASGRWRRRAAEECDKVGRDGLRVVGDKVLGRVGRLAVPVRDDERARAALGLVALARRERGVVPPALGHGLEHGRVRLAAAARLVVDDVDEAARLVGEEPDRLRVGRVLDVGAGEDEALGGVLGLVGLVELLDEVALHALGREVEAERHDAEAVAVRRRVLDRAGKVDERDERRKVVAAQLLVEELADPREDEAVERAGEVVAVAGGALGVEEDGAHLAHDERRPVRQRVLELGRVDAEELGGRVEDVRVLDDGRVGVAVAVHDELDVAEVEDGGEDLAHGRNGLLGEPDGLEGVLELGEARHVGLDRRRRRPRLGEVPERRRAVEAQVLALVGRRAGDEVVEDVEVALAGGRGGDAALLEEVLEALEAREAALVVELELGVAPEARRVGVGRRRGVAERVEDEEGGGDARRELAALLARRRRRDVDKRLEHQPRRLALARARLAAARTRRPSQDDELESEGDEEREEGRT